MKNVNSLRNRFQEYMRVLQDVEEIDVLMKINDIDGEQRADYLVGRRSAIIELKCLESDPEYKIQLEVDRLMQENVIPAFYGKMPLTDILARTPEGAIIKEKIIEKITRSIEDAFRKADKQIESTKRIFSCQNAYGILTILNSDIMILSPEMVAYKVSQLLEMNEPNQERRYRNIACVWLLFDNYIAKPIATEKLCPSIVIEGSLAINQAKLMSILDTLQGNWAAFNKMPYISTTAARISDSNYIRISESDKIAIEKARNIYGSTNG